MDEAHLTKRWRRCTKRGHVAQSFPLAPRRDRWNRPNGQEAPAGTGLVQGSDAMQDSWHRVALMGQCVSISPAVSLDWTGAERMHKAAGHVGADGTAVGACFRSLDFPSQGGLGWWLSDMLLVRD